MTREQFTAKQTEAKQKGFSIIADTGQLTIPTPLGNVIVSYVYTESSQSLELTTVHKPFIVPESAIETEEKQLLG